MATVSRFALIRYNQEAVDHPGRLLAPPYDVLDGDGRDRLIADEPLNSVRIDKPADGTEARNIFDQWLREEILEEGLYGMVVVQQRYIGPDGVRRTRIGVLCEVGLEPFDGGTIHPHERTFAEPRRERQQLLTDAGINTSPVFLLYDDADNPLDELLASVTDDEPDITAQDPDGTQTAAWFIEDVSLLDRIEAAVSGQDMLIADGHHRYTAALAAREESTARPRVVAGNEYDGPPRGPTTGWQGTLAFVANSADPGILVFPTHRVVSGCDPELLEEFLVGSGVLEASEHDDVETAFRRLESVQGPGFVVYTAKRARTFVVPDPTDMVLAAPDHTDAFRSLDVVALHELVLDGGAVLADHAESVSFTRSREEAVQAVDREDATMAFLLREADVDTVHEVARSGELLPQKSTYFYPKVPTGVAFRRAAD